MNVIYTYKKLNHFKPVDDLFFMMTNISVKSANKYYNTILYCDSESKEFFEKNKIPFGKIVILDSLENYTGFIYSIPKILTFIEQTSPYIHIDLDTILFNKINFTSDVLFGYCDAVFKNNTEAKNNQYIKESYIQPLENIFKEDITKFDFTQLPNFSFFGVNDYKLVRNIFESILSKYNHIASISLEKFLSTFNESILGIPSVLEQCLFYNSHYLTKSNYSFLFKYPELSLSNDIYHYNGIPKKYDFFKLESNLYHFAHLPNYRELFNDDNFIKNINKII